jgi:chloride channel protein, CIC family
MPRLSRNARMLLLSVLLGVIGAFAAQIFDWMLRVAQEYLLTGIGHFTPPTPQSVASSSGAPSIALLNWRIPLVTTLGGLIAGVLVYSLAPEAEGHGTDAVVRAYHRERGRIRARIPIVKSIASAITIGSGGSAGREGPTAQISAGVGAVVGSVLRVSDDDRRYLILIGMAAGLSAIFKSPLGTAIFAVEILYGGLAFEETVLSFTIVASAVAYGVTGLFEGWAPLFNLPTHMQFTHPLHLVWYAALGVAAGAIGALLPTVFYGTRDLFKKIPVPPHIKPAIGGLMLGLPAMFLPQVLGGGYGWMQLAIDGRLPLFLMVGLALAKLPALSLTVGSGGSGGVFAPTLYVGTMLGGAIAVGVDRFAPGMPPQAMAVVGMAAMFGAAARVPLATLIMVVEMTGGYSLVVPTMVAVVVAVLLQQTLTRRAKYPSLYEAQVPSPADSPVHHDEYYRTTLSLLRQHRFHLADDVVMHEVADRLSSGQAVELPGTQTCLYSVRIAPKSAVARQLIKDIPLPEETVIVSVLRDRSMVAVHGDTRLEPGDRVVVAADQAAATAVRHLFGDPTAGTGPAAPKSAGATSSAPSR